jgi:hypothetical protein
MHRMATGPFRLTAAFFSRRALTCQAGQGKLGDQFGLQVPSVAAKCCNSRIPYPPLIRKLP